MRVLRRRLGFIDGIAQLVIACCFSILIVGCPDDEGAQVSADQGSDGVAADVLIDDTAADDAVVDEVPEGDLLADSAIDVDTGDVGLEDLVDLVLPDAALTDLDASSVCGEAFMEGGACANESDCAIIAQADVESETLTCATGCLAVAECTVTCLGNAIEITSGCASCFEGLLSCGNPVCRDRCLGGIGQACQDCLADSGCVATFTSCSGFDIYPDAGTQGDPAPDAGEMDTWSSDIDSGVLDMPDDAPADEPDMVEERCVGEPDFTFCSIDTSDAPNSDLSYDICANEVCISPGSCGTYHCNAPGPEFIIPSTDREAADFLRDTPVANEVVIRDTATGLYWQGCTAGLRGADCTMTEADVSEVYEFEGALAYCDALSWGGYTDWYVPSDFELMTLLDFGQTEQPTYDTTVFPGVLANAYLWTSSTSGSVGFPDLDSLGGWRIAFGHGGSVYGANKNADLTVRCVRREAVTLTRPRFVRSEPDPGSHAGDWVVHDSVTELTWEGCAAGQTAGESSCTGDASGMTVVAARDHCGTLSDSGYAGYADWYLPDIGQLRSILQTTNHPLTVPIDASAFPNTTALAGWSNTDVGRVDYHFYIDFGSRGELFSEEYATEYQVRCVRNVE